MIYQFVSCFIDIHGFAVSRFSLENGAFTLHKTDLINYVPGIAQISGMIKDLAKLENPNFASLTILSNFGDSHKIGIVKNLEQTGLSFYLRSNSIEPQEGILLLQHLLDEERLTIPESEIIPVEKALSRSNLAVRADEDKPLLLFSILNGIGWVESKLIALNDEVG